NSGISILGNFNFNLLKKPFISSRISDILSFALLIGSVIFSLILFHTLCVVVLIELKILEIVERILSITLDTISFATLIGIVMSVLITFHIVVTTFFTAVNTVVITVLITFITVDITVLIPSQTVDVIVLMVSQTVDQNVFIDVIYTIIMLYTNSIAVDIAVLIPS